MEMVSNKYVVVHLRLGHDYHDPLATDILEYIADKSSENIVFLSDYTEYSERQKYSKEYGFPETCFYESYDGHLYSVLSKIDFFRGKIVEVMGYYYSHGNIQRCVNNACGDLSHIAHCVNVKQKLVKVLLP